MAEGNLNLHDLHISIVIYWRKLTKILVSDLLI